MKIEYTKDYPYHKSTSKKQDEIERNSTQEYVSYYKELETTSGNSGVQKNNTDVNSSKNKKDLDMSPSVIIMQALIERELSLSWRESLMSFLRAFTFYGLLVLIAVILKRFGKAHIDQSERLHSRRHALREGRLYLHLRKGEIESVEEFDKVFNWNATQENAFTDINTEAQSPWGNFSTNAMKTFSDVSMSFKK